MPMLSLRFAWCASPHSETFVHFAILMEQQCLVQWALPDAALIGRPGNLVSGVWLQQPVSALPTGVVAQGTCEVVTQKQQDSTLKTLQQALKHGRMLLRLTDETGESKAYSLIQLRPGSSAWLLGPASYCTTPDNHSLATSQKPKAATSL